MKNPPKSITILGGTGTLGRALTRSILENWRSAAVTIFSRDEHKQALMKRSFPQVEFRIGDIKDDHTVERVIKNRDLVFHVAALKHVDLMEENPTECFRTNVEGTAIVADLSAFYGVKNCVFSSTDKAVDPINTYGYSKAIAEKILFDWNMRQTITRFSVYRWGNVLGSQGSIIPIFAKTLKEERRAYVTHPDMTRFWLPIEWATRFMMLTYPEAYSDRAMVLPNMKAAKVTDLVIAIADLLDIKSYTIHEIGLRPGEKIHEAIFGQHTVNHLTSESAPKYSMEELRELLRPLLFSETRITA